MLTTHNNVPTEQINLNRLIFFVRTASLTRHNVMVNSKWGLLKFYFKRMHFVCKKKNVHDHKNDDDNDE